MGVCSESNRKAQPLQTRSEGGAAGAQSLENDLCHELQRSQQNFSAKTVANEKRCQKGIFCIDWTSFDFPSKDLF